MFLGLSTWVVLGGVFVGGATAIILTSWKDDY